VDVRRPAAVVLAVLPLLLMAACGGGAPKTAPSSILRTTSSVPTSESRPASTSSKGPDIPISSTTSTSVGVLPSCGSEQLDGQLREIQGATGNWSAVIWLSDTSPNPCTLKPPAMAELITSSGAVGLEPSLATFAPISLSGDTSLPPEDQNPTIGHLASVDLFWPTDADAGLALGSDSGTCPEPDFVPSKIRLVFGNAAIVDVVNMVHGTPASLSGVKVCGRDISLASVVALTPIGSP
jgi:hypothetical protein